MCVCVCVCVCERVTYRFYPTCGTVVCLCTVAPVFKDLDKMQRDQTYVRPVGSTVRLKCRAKGNPEPHVTWFKDDMPVDPEEDARRRPHWILKLTKVQESDTGHYTCMVSNRLGHLNYTYKVEVIGESCLLYTSPSPRDDY